MKIMKNKVKTEEVLSGFETTEPKEEWVVINAGEVDVLICTSDPWYPQLSEAYPEQRTVDMEEEDFRIPVDYDNDEI